MQSENCIWDYMVHARNCFYCTHIHDAEDIKYGEHVWRNAKNIMDASTVGRNASWVYESLNVGIDVNNNLFCIQNWTSQETIYSSSCFNSQKLFWCSGIKKWKNCILNISYSQQEYDYICSRIINHMKNTGEWGEFFPHQLSHFWYNETDAYNHFPHLTEEEVKNHLWNWKEEEETNSYHGPYYNSLPIQEYSEKKVGYEKSTKNINNILNWILRCQVTGKPFKVIKQELAFYIENSIPIPTKHPDQRHKERMTTRNPRELHERSCAECWKKMITSYAPDRPEKIVCETCYQELIY